AGIDGGELGLEPHAGRVRRRLVRRALSRRRSGQRHHAERGWAEIAQQSDDHGSPEPCSPRRPIKPGNGEYSVIPLFSSPLWGGAGGWDRRKNPFRRCTRGTQRLGLISPLPPPLPLPQRGEGKEAL